MPRTSRHRASRLSRRQIATGLATVVAAIGITTATQATAVAECSGTDLARGAVATASGTVNGNGPALAVDGNSATRWESNYRDAQWLQLDLGAVQAVCGVTLDWEGAYGKAFELQTSVDGSSWTTIWSTAGGTGGRQVVAGLSGSGRFLRIDGVQRGTQYGYSLWNVEVHAPAGTSSASTCLSGDLAAGATVTASSSTAGNTPDRAVDAAGGTRWESAWSDAQWLTLDLGTTRTVCGVTLGWENAYAKAFTLQTSTDGTTWTTIHSTTAGTGGRQVLTGLSGTGRYLRLTGIQRATQYGYSLWDVDVFGGTANVRECSGTDLARGAVATASGTVNGNGPSLAVDGNSATRWESNYRDAQWLQLDLGAVQAVCGVTLDWEGAYGKAFEVQTSVDGSSWTTIWSTTSGTGGRQVVTGLSGSGRFLRIDGVQRGTQYGYSLWNVEVHGAGATSTPTASPSPTASPTAAGPSTPTSIPTTTAPSSTSSGRGVAGLSVVNDTTRTPVLGLSPLTEGSVVDLTQVPQHLGVQATLAAGVTVGSVQLTLTGARGTSVSTTQNQAPYFLCGDWTDCPLLTRPDSYTLTAQAHRGANGTGGGVGAPVQVAFSVSAAAVTAPVDVLYVGNSLLGTTTGATGQNTPAVVQSMAAAQGRTVRSTEVIRFGQSLQQTWNSGAVAPALDGTKEYDVVVLQEYSTLVATDPAAASRTLATYEAAVSKVLKPGGRIVLFENWALVSPAPFPDRAANVAVIGANYAQLSAQLTVPNVVAPISDDFETVLRARGTAYLFNPDGKHPTDAATYLDAAALYGIVLRASPRNVPDLYLPAADAGFLRNTAATATGY